MQKLVEGYHHFQTKVFPKYQEVFKELAGKQNPCALFVTCSDSRVMPSLFTQTDPGDLFLCRNAGNMVPPFGDRQGGVIATIEYAVLALEVKHIVVCGHSDCGAMKGVLHPEKVRHMPSVANWLAYGELARRILVETYPEMPEEEQLKVLIRENVLAQLDHLKTHPSVAARLKRRDLDLHGWVYQIETGEIEAYDAETEMFRPLGVGSIPTATPQPRRTLPMAGVAR